MINNVDYKHPKIKFSFVALPVLDYETMKNNLISFLLPSLWIKNQTRLKEFYFLSHLFHYLIVPTGNGELLELRLLETGFLSRFQPNP
jgi:hypothetical protein